MRFQFAAIFFLTSLIAACGCNGSGSAQHINAKTVRSVTFASGKAILVEIGDAQRIERFSKLIERGKTVDEHKCMAVGTLTVAMQSGSETSIGVLLGHSGNDIELRRESQTKLLRVSLAEFLAIFELPPPDESNPSDPWSAKGGAMNPATPVATLPAP